MKNGGKEDVLYDNLLQQITILSALVGGTGLVLCRDRYVSLIGITGKSQYQLLK